eukprot:m.54386 g.54386  ORF g.54386 m.54386 type:complete len:1613 (-) comp16774_c0_seq1:432-5270(-)
MDADATPQREEASTAEAKQGTSGLPGQAATSSDGIRRVLYPEVGDVVKDGPVVPPKPSAPPADAVKTRPRDGDAAGQRGAKDKSAAAPSVTEADSPGGAPSSPTGSPAPPAGVDPGGTVWAAGHKVALEARLFQSAALFFLVCTAMVAGWATQDSEPALSTAMAFTAEYVVMYGKLFVFFAGTSVAWHLCLRGVFESVFRAGVSSVMDSTVVQLLETRLTERPWLQLVVTTAVKCFEPAMVRHVLGLSPLVVATLLSAMLNREVEGWAGLIETACIMPIQTAVVVSDLLVLAAHTPGVGAGTYDGVSLEVCRSQLEDWLWSARNLLLLWPVLYQNFWVLCFSGRFSDVSFVGFVCLAALVAQHYAIKAEETQPFGAAALQIANFFTLELVCLRTAPADSALWAPALVTVFAVMITVWWKPFLYVWNCLQSAKKLSVEVASRLDSVISRLAKGQPPPHPTPRRSQPSRAASKRAGGAAGPSGGPQPREGRDAATVGKKNTAAQAMLSSAARLVELLSATSGVRVTPTCGYCVAVTRAMKAAVSDYISGETTAPAAGDDEVTASIREEIVRVANLLHGVARREVVGVLLKSATGYAESGGAGAQAGCADAVVDAAAGILAEVRCTRIVTGIIGELESLQDTMEIAVTFATGDDTPDEMVVELTRPVTAENADGGEPSGDPVVRLVVGPGQVEIKLFIKPLVEVLHLFKDAKLTTELFEGWTASLCGGDTRAEIQVRELIALSCTAGGGGESLGGLLLSGRELLADLRMKLQQRCGAESGASTPTGTFARWISVSAKAPEMHRSLLTYHDAVLALFNCSTLLAADRRATAELLDVSARFHLTAAALHLGAVSWDESAPMWLLCTHAVASSAAHLITANLFKSVERAAALRGSPGPRSPPRSGDGGASGRPSELTNDDFIDNPLLLKNDAARNPIIDWAGAQRRTVQKMQTASQANEDAVLNTVVDIGRWDSMLCALDKCFEEIHRPPFLATGVIGNVSSGKTTVLNAQLGMDLLPTGTGATSSAPIKIRVDRTSDTSETVITVRSPGTAPNKVGTISTFFKVAEAQNCLRLINNQVRALLTAPGNNDERQIKQVRRFFEYTTMIQVTIEVPAATRTCQPRTCQPAAEDYVDLVGLADGVFVNYPELKKAYDAFLKSIPAFIVVRTPFDEGTTLEDTIRALVPRAHLETVVNKKDEVTDDKPPKQACSARSLLECAMNGVGYDFFITNGPEKRLSFDIATWVHPGQTSLVLKGIFGKSYEKHVEQMPANIYRQFKRFIKGCPAWDGHLLEFGVRTPTGAELMRKADELGPKADELGLGLGLGSVAAVRQAARVRELADERHLAATKFKDAVDASTWWVEVGNEHVMAEFGGEYLANKTLSCVGPAIRQHEAEHRQRSIREAVNLANRLIFEDREGDADHLGSIAVATDDIVDITAAEKGLIRASLTTAVDTLWTQKAPTFWKSLFNRHNPYWVIWELIKRPNTKMKIRPGYEVTPTEHVVAMLTKAFKEAFSAVFSRLRDQCPELYEKGVFPDEADSVPMAQERITTFIESFRTTHSPNRFKCGPDHKAFAVRATEVLVSTVCEGSSCLCARLKYLAALQATRRGLLPFSAPPPAQ